MLLIARYVTLVLAFSVLLTVYLTNQTTTPGNFKRQPYQRKRNVKNIVAYSFRKKIELDGKEIICERLEGFSRASATNFEKLNKPNSRTADTVNEKKPDSNYSAIYHNKVNSGRKREHNVADYVKDTINDLAEKTSTANRDSATTTVRKFDKLSRYETAAVEEAYAVDRRSDATTVINYSVKNNAFDDLDSFARVGGHPNNKAFTKKQRPAAKTIETVRGNVEIGAKNESRERKNYRAGVEPDVPEKHDWVKIPNSGFYAYSAYLDRRLDPYHYIRVIGMVEGTWNETIYCQTVTTDSSYYVTEAIRTDIWWEPWRPTSEDTFDAILFSCQIPTYLRPSYLSLNTKPCSFNRPPIKVSVLRELRPKNFVTVCVKPLDFRQDISKHLIQWIEINKILGANRIEIYLKRVHPNVKQILRWYQKERNVRLFPFEDVEEFVEKNKKSNNTNIGSERKRSAEPFMETAGRAHNLRELKKESDRKTSATYIDANIGNNNDLPASKKEPSSGESQEAERDRVASNFNDRVTVTGNEGNIRKVWQRRKNELISYNDCFYRNIHASSFVLPVDIDEIIVPKRSRTWRRLIEEVLAGKPEADNYATLAVQNTYFLRRFPAESADESVFFLKHYARTDFSPPGESPKSFLATKNALSVFNHYALNVLRPGNRNVFFLPTSLVQMNHYRRSCSSHVLPECAKYQTATFHDTIMMKYKRAFLKNYRQTLKRLSFAAKT